MRDILAAGMPGGGKSLLPVIVAARLITAGIVERVCWAVPRDSLHLQAEEAFAVSWSRALLREAFVAIHELRARRRQERGFQPSDPARGLGKLLVVAPD